MAGATVRSVTWCSSKTSHYSWAYVRHTRRVVWSSALTVFMLCAIPWVGNNGCGTHVAFSVQGAASHAGVSRRGAAVWVGIAPALLPWCVGGEEPWREEIPQTLDILKDLQRQWPEITKLGQKGGGRVRKVLDYTLIENFTISVAKGAPIGATFRNRIVRTVEKPELGWMQKDQVLTVNGAAVKSQVAMLQRMDEAKAASKPLEFVVERRRQSPIDDIERDLVQAYMSLDGDNLPDIDEVVGHLNAARALAFGASSSGRSSSEMLGELKSEIDALIPQLDTVVKAFP